MPIPLPDLDTRRWEDLLDEGRGLIPRYSPGWTDHNIHDPGITLIELLAWLTEQDIYRVNRIPERHYRKFLHLLGYGPEPPAPARVPLRVALADGVPSETLPAGTTVTARRPGLPPLRFRTLAPLTAVPATIAALHVNDGSRLTNRTRQLRDGLPIPLLGENPAPLDGDPDRQPAFLVGFDRELPVGEPVSLWLQLSAVGVDWAAPERIVAEAREQAETCQPVRPHATCPPDVPANAAADADSEAELAADHHHAVRLAWEFWRNGAWQRLDSDAGQVRDTTRGLTLDAPVVVTLPAAGDPLALDGDPEPYRYLRCRLEAGQPDSAPILRGIWINAVAAEQAHAIRAAFAILPGATLPPPGALAPGQRARLLLWLDDRGAISRIEIGTSTDLPEIEIVAFAAPAAGAAGTLEIGAVWLGAGSGLPGQALSLPAAPVAAGAITVWTQADRDVLRWTQRPDLDAARGDDRVFTLDATAGRVVFGDGARGRTVPAGASVFAMYDVTQGAAGNIAGGPVWLPPAAGAELDLEVPGRDAATIATHLASIAAPVPATGGADEERVTHAAGRAASALWAHERSVELCPPDRCGTLDGLDPAQVSSLPVPARAVTQLDYERLALAVPGAPVRRARAWPGIDPDYPCLSASGTVTVIIVPELPASRPQPSEGLIRMVRRYLDRRRTIGTRLLVVGPDYIEVRIAATAQALPGSDEGRVRDNVIAALDAFLDPLTGGPDGRGWPFGRDVYRSEILHVIDAAPGVDHVIALSLSDIPGEEQCGNLCVPPVALVTPGPHRIEVTR
jgi:hypothetical protein